jgi:hypothetical protein
MAPEPDHVAAARTRDLESLAEQLLAAERERERRLEEKLAELDAWMEEAARVQRLLTGGVARREARVRALEDAVEALMAAPAARQAGPQGRDRFNRPRGEMRPVDP